MPCELELLRFWEGPKTPPDAVTAPFSAPTVPPTCALAYPPSCVLLALCRSHGDMELALEAHPTLQCAYMGSTAFALKA